MIKSFCPTGSLTTEFMLSFTKLPLSHFKPKWVKMLRNLVILKLPFGQTRNRNLAVLRQFLVALANHGVVNPCSLANAQELLQMLCQAMAISLVCLHYVMLLLWPLCDVWVERCDTSLQMKMPGHPAAPGPMLQPRKGSVAQAFEAPPPEELHSRELKPGKAWSQRGEVLGSWRNHT